MHVLATLYPLLCAALWRLGGGALTALTGAGLGTDGGRAIRALAAAALAWSYFPCGLLAIPLLFAGLLVGGEGAFQGMGLPPPPGDSPEASWMRWLPERLGLPQSTLGHDFVGMLQVGLVLTAPIALLLLAIAGPARASEAILAAPFVPLAYLAARLPLPGLGDFAGGQSWGEVLTGLALGAAFLAAAI